MPIRFEQMLPRLSAAYERGRLVPFIGSGMSMPVARSWRGLIEGLETAGGIEPSSAPADLEPEGLVRRANKATRKLRLADEERFFEVVRELMGPAKSVPTAQTMALARTWWPLVLTTNYDDLFVAAHRKHHTGDAAHGRDRPIQVLGRSPIDCQCVLSSLTSPSHAILWALQGYLCAPNGTRARRADVERPHEVVIGHEEYRRVANREPHFRRAFAEVYRNRSLFFLGSGLSESYLLDLFGEVLEFYGPSTRPNYAFMRRGEVDPEFMLARFHTEVCEYDDHADLPRMLEQLADTIEQRTSRHARWSYAVAAPRMPAEGAAREDFVVVRGALRPPGDDECLVMSAGERNGELYFGPEAKAVLRKMGISSRVPQELVTRPITKISNSPHVYALLAVEGNRARDLRNVFELCEQLFEEIDRAGVRCAIVQQIYSGKRSLFPERLVLAQVARAFGYWRRVQPKSSFELEIHTWKPAVHHELASGRLDLIEMLNSEDIRFWAEIVEPGGRVERRLFHEHPSFEMRTLLERLELPSTGWTLEVMPAPSPDDVARLAEDTLDDSLIDLGVVPGSAIVLRPR